MKTKLFTLFVALLATTNLWAKFQYGNLYYETLSSNTAKVVGYIGNPTSVSIPSIVQNNGIQYTITSIGTKAFKDCSSLTSITIPNSVTSIEESAFAYCSNLTSVTIPNGVVNIENNAFVQCDNLNNVILTALSVEEFCAGCCNKNLYFKGVMCSRKIQINGKEVTSITIPNSVTTIEQLAFQNCSCLTSVTIPNSVTSIGYCAFRNCSSLTSITIPNSVTSIGGQAFAGCFSQATVTIGNNVTSIGGSAFEDCTSLTSITIPNSVTSIGGNAFCDCSSLASVTIGNSVTSIGGQAFYECYSLKSINIPNGVTSIEFRTFYGCRSLTSITLPNNVTSIGEKAFYWCSSLKKVICTAIFVPSTGGGVFASVPISSAVLYVPDESVDIYKYMDPWDGFGTILPISQLSTDIEDVQIFKEKDTSIKKVIRNGQVVILHNDKSYNIMGQEVAK